MELNLQIFKLNGVHCIFWGYLLTYRIDYIKIETIVNAIFWIASKKAFGYNTLGKFIDFMLRKTLYSKSS
mgnify:CR=1 FL=1